MKSIQFVLLLSVAAIGNCGIAEESKQWKIRTDPGMAAVGILNVEVDKKITPLLSLGVMAWASDDVLGFGEPRYSLGARVDWFEDDVFAKGWHSNAVLKYDFGDDDFTGFRLKLLQTYQAVYHDVFFNAGIGVQFAENSEYSTRILPAWELSIGRAF